ncbi:hypothetical protein K7432_007554 [Basidiobolus ranarum]|uniref:Uncharacterized protein n=1 Tax=Basidiobolus ranarum TaxID=34480 RepID=A0ABR2WTD1_9FUNG
MGNCCSSGTTSSEEATRVNPSHSNYQGKPVTSPPKAHRLGGDGSSASGTTGPADRSAILSAAENRAKKAENRGIQGSGGKLSKQLKEQQKNSSAPDESQQVPDNLVVS